MSSIKVNNRVKKTYPAIGVTFGVICCALSLLSAQTGSSAETKNTQNKGVQLVNTDQGWQLIRNGEPYFIKGAGGHRHLRELVDAGGNSIRTWGADNAGQTLDRAHELGLTVTVGIWLQHERHGFDYSNKQAVAEQLDQVGRFVEQYKDHPALLMWGLGNEAEGDGNNPLVWQAINDAAKLTKQIDPNHPTMTVISEVGGDKIKNLQAYCPAIDVLGINSYGGLPSLGQRSAERGLDRPYIVTEFGPLGQWEVGKTLWGVPIEQTSTEKAKFCAQGYAASIAGQPGRCLGGYVFNWGNKQEVTPTWYSLFLPDDGGRTETVDVMTRAWTGHWPDNRAPAIERIEIIGDTNALESGKTYQARVSALDPENDDCEIRWVVQSETTDRKKGGDHEATPPTHPEAILSTKDQEVTFRAPDQAGPYRLYVYIKDPCGGVATGNIPFLVVR